MTALAPHLRALDGAALAADRASRRRFAASYVRSASHLFRWTFPPSRMAVALTEVYPFRPDVTRDLCHAVYRDIQVAKALGRHIVGRQMRVDELRRIFTAECEVYRKQRASVAAQQGYTGLFETINQAAE